jgi:hypothetical protein
MGLQRDGVIMFGRFAVWRPASRSQNLFDFWDAGDRWIGQ